MGDGLYVAAAGALARDRQLDLLADNLANVNTDGYRQGRASFQTVLADAAAGAEQSTLAYLKPGRQAASTLAGPVRETGRPLDVAIDGDAFFGVEGEGEGEVLYTRLGRFTIDEGGHLVTQEGRPVIGSTGPISGLTAGGEVRIERNGTVYLGDRAAGKIATFTFERPDELVRQGALLYAAPDQEAISSEPALVPRSIEGSNVNAIAAMTEMIRLQRAFEGAHKAIDAYRQMDRQLTTDVA